MIRHNLIDFVNKDLIVNNGYFCCTGSAKAEKKGILCYVQNKDYAHAAIENDNISSVITTPEFAHNFKNKGLIIHEEPVILLGEITNRLIKSGELKPKMDFSIDSSAKIDSSSNISPKCKIGKNVSIGRNVIIHDYTIIGDNSIIGDNVVLGCEGLFFRRKKNGDLFQFLHAGGVNIANNVEILTGSMVQKAHNDIFTSIGKGCKISVNVNVGHSVQMGEHCLIAGNVQISGNVTLGDFCWIGASATISDGIKIGNKAEIKIGSVVIKEVKPNEVVSGNFAMIHGKTLKNYVRNIRV